MVQRKQLTSLKLQLDTLPEHGVCTRDLLNV
jgi:hypothetical protein